MLIKLVVIVPNAGCITNAASWREDSEHGHSKIAHSLSLEEKKIILQMCLPKPDEATPPNNNDTNGSRMWGIAVKFSLAIYQIVAALEG